MSCQKLTVMKSFLFLFVLTIVIFSCATTSKTTNEAIYNKIIGQNEMVVLKKLGVPTRIEHTSDEGKIMIYEFSSKGMYLTPNKKPSITYNVNRDITGEMQGLTYTSNVNTATNDPKYTIYPTEVSHLKVYIDKLGYAIRIEQDLPQEQLDIYHERFKHFNAKDR